MFLKDCWYMAAWAAELDEGKLIGRTLLEEPVLLYRGESGAAVVLDNRCCHRGALLSNGRREGDCVRCLYHGLKFDATGRCVQIPGQDMIPATACVRAYPVVEKHSWIWVWMGDPAKADERLIPPAVGLQDPAWTLRSGRLDYEANYLLINDNLTDFTHLS